MQSLITYIVRGLVNDPETVDVREASGETAGLFEIRVAPDDQGKVIGRNGRTIHAVRALVSAAAARRDMRVSVEVVDR